MKPYYERGGITIFHGDCREVLARLEPESIDAVVTDPPYGLEFMGREWDKLGGGIGEVNDTKNRDGNWTPKPFGGGGNRVRYGKSAASMQAWHLAWATEAIRVLKPGGHLLAFGGTRTYHRMACAIEDAGFEIRDQIGWMYGSGFPKSLDVSKAIDKAAGAERELGPKRVSADGTVAHDGAGRRHDGWERPWRSDGEAVDRNTRLSYPATDAAKQWHGWGTALKPAWEPIVVARKPLIGTVVENVLAHGTGGLNIDGCRIAGAVPTTTQGASSRIYGGGNGLCPNGQQESDPSPLGRFPANVIHDGSDEVIAEFAKYGESVSRASAANPTPCGKKGAVLELSQWDNTSGAHHEDRGTPARFFYCAKASSSERESFNNHPTVKPVELMKWLCRLVAPPDALILDPFAGSGSTLIAAREEGFRIIGIEQEADYVEIIKRRLRQEVLF